MTYGIVIANTEEGSYIEVLSVDDTIILYGILNRIGACEVESLVSEYAPVNTVFKSRVW
jgi:hypothetical protein